MARRSRTKAHPAKVGVVKQSQPTPPPHQQVGAGLGGFSLSPPVRTAMFVVALTLIIWGVYFHSLHRVFIGDQLGYLAELNGSTSLWDGLRHYDYALTRQYSRGDESLYRPLLFVWLALNHWAFGSDYFWWNVANLGLHVVVTFLLYGLLRTLQPSPVAGVFALLFAVLTSQFDLVVWNHLGGYLAGFAFFLLGLIAVHRAVSAQQPSKIPWLALFAVSMTAACLFYEVLVVMSAIVALYLFHGESRRSSGIRWRVVLASLIPGVVFTSLYVVHALQCPRFSYVDHATWNDHVVTDVVYQGLNRIGRWLWQTLCPWDYAYVTNRFVRNKLVPTEGAPLVTLWAAAACLLSLFGLRKAFDAAHLRQRLPLVLALTAMVLAYTTIIGIGRRGELADNPYYLYFFSLLLVILLYALPDWSPQRVRLAPVLCGLGLFVIVNAALTCTASTNLESSNRESDRYFTTIRQFVAEHRHEPGFSFAVRRYNNEDTIVTLGAGYPDAPTKQRKWLGAEIFFAQYYESDHPLYVLGWDGKLLTVTKTRP